MQRFRVRSKYSDYDVVVGRGAWRDLRRLVPARYSSRYVLAEAPLWKRWGKNFLRESSLGEARIIFVHAGERSKSLEKVEQVASELLRSGADRQSLLVAFGGGVIGDLGGFVASTYMRGIEYVQAPTTVVAQVDSSVGGKTGVNVGAMKNLVGTFYPPRLVLAEPRVLSSMPRRAFRSGLYEVVKHAILAGQPVFDQLEAAIDSLRPGNAAALTPVLGWAVKIKIDVVNRDERESRLRQVLNLGHTFGHALEEATHYRRFMHGEAVGWGLLGAVCLAERIGMLEASEASRIFGLVARVGPLPGIRHLDPGRVLRLVARDKKTVRGRVHWVLPERIGEVRIVADVSEAEARAAFRDIQRSDRIVAAR